jgi:rod shape-determining protein MreD
MKYLLWPIAVFLSFFLQGRVSVLGISPDLTVLLAYYAGMRYGEARGLLAGAVIGALEDSLSSSIIGPNLLSKGIIGFSSSFFVSGGFLRWTPFLGLLVVAFLTVADNAMVFFARSIFDKVPAATSAVLFISVMQAILNAIAGIFIRPKHAD